MSVDVHIDTATNVSMAALSEAATSALRRVAGMSRGVAIEIHVLGPRYSRLPLPRDAGLFDHVSYLACLEGDEEGARTSIWSSAAVPGDVSYATVSLDSRCPVGYLVTAVIASELARLAGARVGDGGFFCPDPGGYFSADEFLAGYLGNPAAQESIRRAVAEMRSATRDVPIARMELPGSVRLAAEFKCFPTWRVRGDGVEDVDPRDLGLGDDLVAALVSWDAEYQASYEPERPQDSGFASVEDMRDFAARGRLLARRLAAELPDVPELTYFDMNAGRYEWLRVRADVPMGTPQALDDIRPLGPLSGGLVLSWLRRLLGGGR